MEPAKLCGGCVDLGVGGGGVALEPAGQTHNRWRGWCGREREAVTVGRGGGGAVRPDGIILVEQVAAPRLLTGLQFPPLSSSRSSFVWTHLFVRYCVSSGGHLFRSAFPLNLRGEGLEEVHATMDCLDEIS